MRIILLFGLLVFSVKANAQDTIRVAIRMDHFLYRSAPTDYGERTSGKMESVNKGDSITISSKTDRDYIQCRSGNKVGYIHHIAIMPTNEVVAFADWPEKIEEYFIKIIKDIEWKKSFRADLDSSIRVQKEGLIKKYGRTTGARIANGEIWIGMKRQMLIDSRGYPEDVNRTVTSRTVHEQFVYGDKYIYVENGIVTAWQD